MSAWLLNHVRPWMMLVGFAVLFAGGAVLVQMFVRRRFPALKEQKHNDLTNFAFIVVAFLYSFLSGFMINAMWGQITGADTRAATEGSAAMQQAKTLVVFEKSDANRIRQSLLDYLHAAETEWPLAAAGQTHPEADNALQRLYATYAQLHPTDETQQKFLSVSLNNLDTMSALRTERLTIAVTDTGPPASLWLVNFVTSGMVLAGAIIYGGKSSRQHHVMVAALGVLIACILFLMVEISHPYIGEIATSPEPLFSAARYLSALQI